MSGHPWELTLEEFVQRAREYGLTLSQVSKPVANAEGLELVYLQAQDGRRALLPRPPSYEIMPLDILENLIRSLGLPRADFGLDPDPED